MQKKRDEKLRKRAEFIEWTQKAIKEMKKSFSGFSFGLRRKIFELAHKK